jgi:hypothetical protein
MSIYSSYLLHIFFSVLCPFIYLLGIVKVFSFHYSWQGDLSCRPNFPELNEKQITVLEKNSNLNLILKGTVS